MEVAATAVVPAAVTVVVTEGAVTVTAVMAEAALSEVVAVVV